MNGKKSTNMKKKIKIYLFKMLFLPIFFFIAISIPVTSKKHITEKGVVSNLTVTRYLLSCLVVLRTPLYHFKNMILFSISKI